MAAVNPLQQSRNPAYIAGGLAGILALAMLLAQPLLAAGYLPGMRSLHSRRVHRWMGSVIVVAVALHIVGLYVTSPDDMTDAMLLVAPTPFSVYGVIGLWSVALTAFLVVIRNRLSVRPSVWNIIHNILALVVVVASVVHALMIEGAMGTVSKWFLCTAIICATVFVMGHLRLIRPFLKK